MVIHHAHGLHEGVADRGPHEGETTPFEFFAQDVRFRRGSWKWLRRPPRIYFRRAPDKLPEVPVERSELLLYLQESLCVLCHRSDLQEVANNAGIAHECLQLAAAEACNAVGIETTEGGAIVLTFLEDGVPA